MKKIIVLALGAALLLGGTVTAYATTASGSRPCRQEDCFVDADENGVCDNGETCAADGNCAGNGQNCRQKDCFVDADENGVCDNRAEQTAKGGCGNRGQVRGSGNHHAGGGRGCERK